jgi:BirA family transcriptional regulator, biotin operon repressor / biotin---[acetyl-CoA-carboxylase] ligase
LSFPRESRIISVIAKTALIRARRPSHAGGGTPVEVQSIAQPNLAQINDARLNRIVRLLMEHATVVVSGTKIAQEISSAQSSSGQSSSDRSFTARSSSGRSEVWRLIQQLRSLGVDIAGHPATGYQLRAVPDLLLPEILRPLVRGTLFDSHLHHFYKIGSTNTGAMAAASEGAPEGSVFLAEEQIAGRGRGSNAWQSPRSTGIYCSVILRPSLPPSDVLVLSLAAGLAVQAAIRHLDPNVTPDLKWPNDVLIEGKKVSGILTEMNAEATRVRYIVVGIGINVNQESFPKELTGKGLTEKDLTEKDLSATSLRLATGKQWSRVELLAALLKSLDHEYRQFVNAANARESVLRRFAENSSWVKGKTVRIEDNGASSEGNGLGGIRFEGTRLEGTTDGLDPRGFLLVRTSRGVQTVLSGTVREA